jgi:uncharacterized repeat protein (TIGR03803 family)
MEGNMRTLNLSETVRIVFLVSCVAMPIGMPAQVTFSDVGNFYGSNGENPYAGLIQATDGNFYGTTAYGGTDNENGVIFKITPDGQLTTLHRFDGPGPRTPLVQARNGRLYGTVGCTFFEITLDGAFTTIYNFLNNGCTSAGLVQGTDGNFYGTTSYGGTSSACGTEGCGTVFKITDKGILTILHSFDLTDGMNPHAGLVQGTDGNFYGTTLNGGTASSDACPSECGTVFKITPAGQLTTLHQFDGLDGYEPDAPLVQALNGRFYGTTLGGGADHYCSLYSGCGTIFEMTPSGELSTIYSFESTGDFGNALYYFAIAGLVQGTDGNLYGTTYAGGDSSECTETGGPGSPTGCGTIFKITGEGTFTTLYSFGSYDDAYPFDGLVQGTEGSFYGTTWQGGGPDATCPPGCGTVFSLSVGLGPFVKTSPTSGRVGAVVTILGSDLIGTRRVRFNDTTAPFIVVSKSEIEAIVPSGATTGTVEVITHGHTLKSNVPFRVTK